MKKLRKVRATRRDTIEAYCICHCPCGCVCNCPNPAPQSAQHMTPFGHIVGTTSSVNLSHTR